METMNQMSTVKRPRWREYSALRDADLVREVGAVEDREPDKEGLA